MWEIFVTLRDKPSKRGSSASFTQRSMGRNFAEYTSFLGVDIGAGKKIDPKSEELPTWWPIVTRSIQGP